MSFGGTDAKSPTVLDRVTVTGAATCVAVGGSAIGVELTHLVVRDCATAGITVAAAGGAAIANATVATNGIGVDATGISTIKNSLVSGNDVGLKSEGTGDLASSYDDLFGNTIDYKGLVAGAGDLAAAVTFVDLSGHNLMLSGPPAVDGRRRPGGRGGRRADAQRRADQPGRVRRDGGRRDEHAGGCQRRFQPHAHPLDSDRAPPWRDPRPPNWRGRRRLRPRGRLSGLEWMGALRDPRGARAHVTRDRSRRSRARARSPA